MGIYEDYVNGLDGQENIDVLAVVKDLSRLHNEEIGTWEAKVETQSSDIAARDATIAEKQAEVTKFKAMNLDLTLRLPGQDVAANQNVNRNQDESVEGRAPTIMPDDLFN